MLSFKVLQFSGNLKKLSFITAALQKDVNKLLLGPTAKESLGG